MSYNIYFDGASRNNPGICSSAGIIIHDNNIIFTKVTKYKCDTNREYNV